MQSYGNIGPYDRNGEEWPAYCERVELYLDANKIANEEQRRAISIALAEPTHTDWYTV